MNNSTATVFIIDDDPAIRDALSLMIEQEHIAVATFENAEAFLASCQSECYGCAIIDIRMPGMDGMQLQEVLSKRNIHPVSYTHLTFSMPLPDIGFFTFFCVAFESSTTISFQ